MSWVKAPSGDWWLFDKPAGTPRSPVATIQGGARIGFWARIHGASGQIEGRSVASLKKQVEAICA